MKKPSASAPIKYTALKINQRIRRDIEGKILSGKWPPGHKVPREYELMEQYDCSRMTVHKVLAAIAATGLVERRRKAGTIVASSFAQSAVLEIKDVKEEVLARGENYHYELLSRSVRRSSPADRIQLDTAVGQKVLAIQGRHFANGRPFTVEDRIINLAAAPEAADEDFSSVSPGSWLIKQIPWTEAEHRISAMNADATTALLLGVPVNTACLSIERKTWRSGQTVTFVRLTYPGTHFHLFANFTPRSSSP